MNKWKHLQLIKLPDIKDCRHRVIPKVKLMIGSNVPAASQPVESVTGNVGEPYAVRSPLGWLVYGLVNEKTQNNDTGTFQQSDHKCRNQ